MQAIGHILGREVLVDPLAHDDFRLVDLLDRILVDKVSGPMTIVHQSQHVHYDSGQCLLKSRPLLSGNIQGLNIQVDNTFVEPDIEHRSLIQEKALFDDPVDHRPLETDPILLPPAVGKGTIGVPHARKEKEHLALGNQLRLPRIAIGEDPLSVGDVEQLILAQDPSFVDIERIPLRMSGRWILLLGRDLLAPHTGNHQSPQLVLLRRYQILGFIITTGLSHDTSRYWFMSAKL